MNTALSADTVATNKSNLKNMLEKGKSKEIIYKIYYTYFRLKFYL